MTDQQAQHLLLLYKSAQVAIKLLNRTHERGRAYNDKARPVLVKMWQRHWRRVSKFNKSLNENLYIPEWYIADLERENEQEN